MTRAAAKSWIEQTCGMGWLTLIDEVYDALPSHISVIQVYQKWGTLHFDLENTDEHFQTFIESIQHKSSLQCEKCGRTGKETIVDHWIYTRCELHSN